MQNDVFFEVKLLKCILEKKINLKNAPQNDIILTFEEKKKLWFRGLVGHPQATIATP
jgi:hypothetical protein